jgi:AcrR family transcriptional regulator
VNNDPKVIRYCVLFLLGRRNKVMPSLTFNKLPPAKRDKFIRVAMAEFASAGYEKASVTQMVKKLKIAKGSVYQYFENKKELYFYLLETAQIKRQEYMKPVLRNPPDSFWELYVALFRTSVQFDYENPEMSALIANSSYEKYSEDLGNLMLNQKKKSLDFMRGLLERELLRGGLRNDVNIDVMAFFAANITNGIWDYLSLKKMNGAKDKKGKLIQPKEQVAVLLGDLSKLMKSGLKS